jgi:uncharacterized membrane protein YdjX (TVP38/TMEM64 family)
MMLTKLTELLSQTRTLQLLAFIIISLVILLGAREWFSNASLLQNNVNSFSLRDWTVELAAHLNWLDNESDNLANSLTLFAFLALATSIGLPRQIAAFVAGINLGAFFGVIIATLATTLGCLMTYSVAYFFLNAKVTAKYPKKVKVLSDFLHERTFLKAIALRILPLGSNFLANIIAGISQVPANAFIGGSFIGFIPQMIIFSLAGSGISIGATNELIVSIILFITALIIGLFLVKVHRLKST